jgi:uncharacterized protein (DUF885 family)
MARAIVLLQAWRMSMMDVRGIGRMNRFKLLLAIALTGAAAAEPAHADASADLNKLMRDYRDAESKLQPGYTKSSDPNASAAIDAQRHINTDISGRLAVIDETSLKPQDALSYEIFRWALDDEARELKPGIAESFELLALNQFDGAQITFPRDMQSRAERIWSQPKEYDDAIRRMLRFTNSLDSAIDKLREGIKRGIVQPRALVVRMIAQAETFAKDDGESSLFMTPLKTMPVGIAGAERARIEAAYREAVGGQLIPAYRRLLVFLNTEYLPRARDTIGLSAIPGGKDMYLYLVKSRTTSDLTPEAIHALGLSDLKRIEAQMVEAKNETGFKGSLAQFSEMLHSDPRFKFKDPAAMLAEFNRVKDAVNAHLGELFIAKPKASLSFRMLPSYAAPDRPAAEYAAASGDGRRPGIVFLNASDLQARPTYTSEVLAMHEGIPGHHLQVALTMENRALPRFRRFGDETAFTEGWALYAETLGPELGLYSDPYQKYGALSFDAWRASRLVVDTGIHWLGWTRDSSIAFLKTHGGLSENEAAEEVDRYIAIPAQALSYKIGEREILDLRMRAQTALGAKFDIRRFHEAVLKDGAMPLPILDAKMSRWIAAEKAA